MDMMTGVATVLIAAASTAVGGGPGPVHINASRSLPMMQASAIWQQAATTATPTTAHVGLAVDAVLYEETMTARQLAGTLTAPMTLGGARPVAVPAGTVFAAWWVEAERRACTSAGTDPATPDKPAYQVCLVSRGGSAMDTAIVRKLREPASKAETVPLPAPVTLKGVTTPGTETAHGWPGAVVASYLQSGRVIVTSEYARALLVPELSYARRVAIAKVAGDMVTLRCQDRRLDDLAKPVAAQSDGAFKVEEDVVDLASGHAETSLCGGRFALRKAADGSLDVTVAAGFAPWWSLDPTHHELRWGDATFVYGAPVQQG